MAAETQRSTGKPERMARAGTLVTSKHAAAARDLALNQCGWLGPDAIARLTIYHDLLVDWQARHNLVASSTLNKAWSRHFADSLQLLDLAPAATRSWIDLGSGAGFPGMVVAVATADRDSLAVTLVESNGKKCAFLRAVAAATNTDVTIIQERIEDHGRAINSSYDVVSARALAPLDRLFRLANPYAGEQTCFLFPKGRDFVGEDEFASKSWRYDLVLSNSLTDPRGRVAIVTHLSPKGADHE